MAEEKSYDSISEDEQSYEVIQILKKPSSRILNSGSSILFITIFIILIGMTLIKLPDEVEGELSLKTNTEPTPIYFKSEGVIDNLLIGQNDYVVADQPLLIYNTRINYTSLNSLKAKLYDLLTELDSGLKNRIKTYHFENLVTLNELNDAYQTFYIIWVNYQNDLKTGKYNRERSIKEAELRSLVLREKNLQKQLSIQDQILRLARKEYTLRQEEFKQGLISQIEFNLHEQKYLNLQIPYEQSVAVRIENDLKINLLKNELQVIEEDQLNQNTILNNAVRGLLIDIKEWEESHVIKALHEGQILFSRSLSENEVITSYSEPILFISSLDTEIKSLGEMKIVQNRFGLVKPGQKVIIEVEGYPAKQFGSIIGQVESISNVIEDDFLYIQVEINNEFLTDKEYKIPYKPGMSSLAKVITEDRTLFERVFQQIVKITL